MPSPSNTARSALYDKIHGMPAEEATAHTAWNIARRARGLPYTRPPRRCQICLISTVCSSQVQSSRGKRSNEFAPVYVNLLVLRLPRSFKSSALTRFTSERRLDIPGEVLVKQLVLRHKICPISGVKDPEGWWLGPGSTSRETLVGLG